VISNALLCVTNFSKLLFAVFTEYFCDLLVDSKSLVFQNYYCVSLFFSKLLLCGTLCVIVLTSMTIVSIADEDPRVVHGSVVLTESLLLWWTWNCNQKFSLVVPSSRLNFSAFPCSHKNSCYPLSQTTPCQTVHEIFKNVANASHTSMHVSQHCPRWMQSTGHNAESVHLCWAPFVIIDCHVLEKKASFISWYNTIVFLSLWSCTWVAFWKNSHSQTTMHSITLWQSFKWLLSRLHIITAYYHCHIN